MPYWNPEARKSDAFLLWYDEDECVELYYSVEPSDVKIVGLMENESWKKGDMYMNEQVKEYLHGYTEDIKKMFCDIRHLIMQMQPMPQEKLWAKLPSFYVGESFVRLIPFKDHINIEAKAIVQYQDALADYKITPKGMLQIYLKDPIPFDVLGGVFRDTLFS